jgi:hypothetical protein
MIGAEGADYQPVDAALQKPDGSREKIDDSKLYRVVAGLYSDVVA